MGLLKRFRASSSASARQGAGPDTDFIPPPMPPPPIMTHSHSQLYASTSRASFAESTTPSTSVSAAGMETPKSSRSFWKRKQKGKDKEVVGLSYESLTSSPSRLPQNQQYQNQNQPQGSRSSSFVHVPAPRRELSHRPQPQDEYRREGSSTPKQETTPKGISRAEPRQMLGKLDFEGDAQGPNLAGGEMYARPQALRTSSIPFGTSSSQQSTNGRPVTAIFLERPDKQDLSVEGSGRMSLEEMEHLASPEKRVVYTPNARRMSRSGVQDEPGSPTPRKGTLPPQELTSALRPKASRTSSSDDHHARPTANRRNSFIPLGNPFSRSSTRTSINDLDTQPVDDKSFQLRSFRHVSGASQADHDLDPYHKVSGRVEADTSPINNFTPIPRPTSVAPPTQTQPQSRPMSRTASLASLDDHIASSAKVSAAAFRKGIRRPSSTYLDEAMDHDDDVPLGMLRNSGRQSSAISLSSMDGAGARLPVMMKSPGKNVNRVNQSVPTTPSTNGNMVKSPSMQPVEIEKASTSHIRSKTMPLISPEEIHPIFPSPTHSPAGSPRMTTHPDPLEERPDRATTKATPPPVESPAPVSPEFDFSSLDYPVSAFSTSPQATKVVKPPVEKPTKLASLQTSGLAVSIPSPAGTSVISSTISPAPTKLAPRQDTLDEDLVVRSMASYGDDIENEPPTPRVAIRQQSHSSLFAESISSDANSTVRSPLSERLGNLVGPRPMGSRTSLPKLSTLKLDDAVRSPTSDTTISPIIASREQPTPTSRFARVTNHSARKVESDSDQTDSEDDYEPEPPAPVRPANPPRSSFANARPVSSFMPFKSSSKPQDDSDNESDDMPLARIKSKASRSSLAAANQAATGLRPATIHSSSPKPVYTASPPVMTPDFSRRASVPDAVGASVPTPDILGQKLWDASPASSQSGLTGDSSSVQPITPSDREMDGKVRDGSFPPAPIYHTALRTPADQLVSRPQSVMSGTSTMDDAARQRMKEMWQAQYMAAASKAFEEEWERQSNVSGSVAPSVQSFSPYTQTPSTQQHYPPMAMGYNYPPQFRMYPSPHPGPHMPWTPPPHEQSMYAYGPGTQSVYGGEFGPPSMHGMPASPYRPMSVHMGMGMGMGMPQSYSATNLHQYSPQSHAQRPQLPTSQSSYFTQSQSQPPAPPQGYPRSSSSQHLPTQDQNQGQSHDLTPPPTKRGLIHQIPNSPKGASNRRSQLGISVINADDRQPSERERERQGGPGAGPVAQPPTAWRRSTAPLVDREDQSAPRRKRQSSYLVN